MSPENLARLDAFPRSYEVDTEVDLPGGSGGEQVHYVTGGHPWGVGRDGALMRFRPEGVSPWLGMFAGCMQVSACPHPFQLLAWGEQTLLGDVRDPRSFRAWGPWHVLHVVAAPAARRLVAVGWGDFMALGPDGPIWEHDARDWMDGQHTVRLEGDVLRVVAQSTSGPFWQMRFDVATGAVRSREELPGSNYGEPDPPLP